MRYPISVEAPASNGSIPNIFGKRQSIDDVSAEGQSREPWDRGGTDDKIATETQLPSDVP